MSNLRFYVDTDRLAKQFDALKEDIKADLTKGVENLANMTHAKTLEIAGEELTSLQKMYKDNVEFSNPEPNFWVVTLKEPAMWIEEGRKCVVYGKNGSHIPKILTPDGEIPIINAKKGMLVLNQFGKWTKILEIYDEHLVEKSKMSVEKVEQSNFTPENNKKHKRLNNLYFTCYCPVCHFSKNIKKINQKTLDKGIYCEKCLINSEVYRVKIGGALHKKNKTVVYLTGDHKVLTNNGWKEIREVDKQDKLQVPSWANCNEIKMLNFQSFEITKKKLRPASPINRRWDITVEDGESFVCNGFVMHNSGFMEELLNGKSGRTGKNGKYAIIPFQHNKNPTEQSPKAYDLAQEIKYELKKKGVNWKKIETDSDGSPRLGKLHTFQFDNARAIAQKATHKNPLTKGVSVYQTKQKDGSVRRDVMTFRVISEKSRNEGAWIHPGRPGNKILDKAFEWAMQTWERDILPAVFAKYGKE